MLHFVKNDTSLVFQDYRIYCLLCFSKLRACTFLDFEIRMIPKLKKQPFQFVYHPKISVEKDPSFVLPAHQAPEILHFVFLLTAEAIILEITLLQS